MYRVSADCLTLTKAWEGCVPRWYHDIASIETGGYGHVRLAADRPGPAVPFSVEAMTAWLLGDMGKCERAINGLGIPIEELGQHRADALADACFNCGTGLLNPSNTITKALRARKWDAAGDALLEWCHARIGGVVVVNAGLFNRRKAERVLFNTPGSYAPITDGYETCGAMAICNPDLIREIMAQEDSLFQQMMRNDPSIGGGMHGV